MAKKKDKKMSEEELLEKLATLKSEKQEIEKFQLADIQEEIKAIEKELTSRDSPIEKAETAAGKLCLVRKPNYKIPDNLELIDQSSITRSIFLQKAKMSITDVKSALAEGEMEELIEKGVIRSENPTMYYQLKD